MSRRRSSMAPETRPSDRALRWLLWALALAPLGWLATFAGFVLRTYLALGRWPKPYDPDPMALGFTIHYYAVQGGIVLLFAGPATALLITALWYRQVRGVVRRPSLLVVAALGGLGFDLLLARVDSWHIFTWLGD
jgi:hypothetical protein